MGATSADRSSGASRVVRADGAELLVQVKAPASAQNAAFSPDGSRILFTLFTRGYDKGPAGLYLVDRDGTRVRPLYRVPGHDCVNSTGGCWSKDGRRIVFSSDAGGQDDIWTLDVASKEATELTRHTEEADYVEPVFVELGEPFREWIMFEVDAPLENGGRAGTLYAVGANGMGLTQITWGPEEARDERQPAAARSAGGQVFQRRKAGSEDWDIWFMSPKELPVALGASSDTDPALSPDGRWVVYSSDHGGLRESNIFTVPINGGRPRRVTRAPDFEDAAPSWSPGGAWIVFESHALGEDSEGPASLWRIRAPVDGAAERND